MKGAQKNTSEPIFQPIEQPPYKADRQKSTQFLFVPLLVLTGSSKKIAAKTLLLAGPRINHLEAKFP